MILNLVTTLLETEQNIVSRFEDDGGLGEALKGEFLLCGHCAVVAFALQFVSVVSLPPRATMESRPIVPDQKLLARLVLIREKARNMTGGGILDERNDRGFTTLPEAEFPVSHNGEEGSSVVPEKELRAYPWIRPQNWVGLPLLQVIGESECRNI
ncbi:hypothetical protein MKW98_020206 [Papaver atlanticum]|uniref:Uncharacterized protein n=1 Tax=Papaver atlanticum TaxID=357466 RepID=A0AAD4XBW6_9MAGN|nr:hypothetical protein MKW98_020206 [Papaver atlanticum]